MSPQGCVVRACTVGCGWREDLCLLYDEGVAVRRTSFEIRKCPVLRADF